MDRDRAWRRVGWEAMSEASAPPVSIVEFLTARLDEDAARLDRAAEAEAEALRHDGMPDTTAQEIKDFWLDPETETEWPRVLADIAAKRAILDVHKIYVEGKRESPNIKYSETWKPDVGCVNCDWDNDCAAIEDNGYPCETVKLLASVYSDHPDYRQEWRP